MSCQFSALSHDHRGLLKKKKSLKWYRQASRIPVMRIQGQNIPCFKTPKVFNPRSQNYRIVIGCQEIRGRAPRQRANYSSGISNFEVLKHRVTRPWILIPGIFEHRILELDFCPQHLKLAIFKLFSGYHQPHSLLKKSFFAYMFCSSVTTHLSVQKVLGACTSMACC